MEKVLSVLKLVMEHGPAIVAALVAILTGVIGIAMLIPGEQPEKALKGVVAFLEKFSAKPKKEEG